MSAILEAFLICLLLGLSFMLALVVIMMKVIPEAVTRPRALPRGRKSDRVTTQECHQAHRSMVREAEAVEAFRRAELAAGGASC